MKQKKVQLEALMDSKKEYMDHLFDLVTEPMVITFQELYQDCLNDPLTRKKGILNAFQDALTNIAAWNHHTIKEHYDRIVTHTGCKYLPELIRALINVQVKINLIANSKTMTANNIKLKIPSAENFIHRFYIDVARGIWKRPYLLYHNVRSVEKQQNLLDLEKLIQQTIRITLRGYVPMEQLIAVMNLSEDLPESDSETDTKPTKHQESESSESESDDDNETENTVDDTETESDPDSDVESIVEVVELPAEEELQNEPKYDQLQNEVVQPEVSQPQVDITVIHEETEPEHQETAAETVEDVVDQVEPEVEYVIEEERKNIEYVDAAEAEPVSPQVHLNKVPEDDAPIPAPVFEESPRSEVEDRTSPFNMMIMNRKIITHRPPTTMVFKKKKRDAFF